MTTFVIKDEAGVHVGFLGFASHPGDWPPPGRHDCVFMRLANEASDSTAAGFVARNAGREWSIEVDYRDDLMVANVELADGWSMQIKDGEAFAIWRAGVGDTSLHGYGLFI